MYYRTRTYIAADWDGDKNAVDVLYSWNDNKYLALSFTNAHDLMQARDSSLNCSIKNSLKERMDASKTFVLIVGSNTTSGEVVPVHIAKVTIAGENTVPEDIALIIVAILNMNVIELLRLE